MGNEKLLKQLSPRELDVLREMEGGRTNLEIAQRLFLSVNTVKHHVRTILTKLGFVNRRQAAEFARKNGLVSKFPNSSES